MRTTLNLDTDLVLAAKRRAVEEQVTLTRLLESALQAYLRPPEQRNFHRRTRLLTRKVRPLPGVDFADRDTLYDRMEGRR